MPCSTYIAMNPVQSYLVILKIPGAISVLGYDPCEVWLHFFLVGLVINKPLIEGSPSW